MTGKMFPFITGTWNPVAGPCPYDCSYCWAKVLINRRKYAKYRGTPRLDEKAMSKVPKRGFIFVQDMSDVSVLGLEDADYLISQLAEHPLTDYLLLTKNPAWYVHLSNHGVEFPQNVVLGATIETDAAPDYISKAPSHQGRINAMQWLNDNLVNIRLFISVEPVMEFSKGFMFELCNIHPSNGVAVGYDNYNNKLPEPCLTKTRELVESLRKRGITVYEKTMREAWDVEKEVSA